ncbi:transposase, IS30 family [Actinopolyspora xinjiangensis]|uniref:Transposase, IS30 family n=2 Tax=Actinopolyspora xinjiangensis TaxID=405564 RepID=A0A1H0RZ90_9ACTN|nr:transposase, IS30 family [Actinopolyspora xinjiangensis]
MPRHADFTMRSNMPAYFCDPRSPWQRGTNENTNRLLREYFPKGTDLSDYSQPELDAVADELNDRPRETLGWRKPNQVFNELLLNPTDAPTT